MLENLRPDRQDEGRRGALQTAHGQALHGGGQLHPFRDNLSNIVMY